MPTNKKRTAPKTQRLSRQLDQRKLVGRFEDQTRLTWKFFSMLAEDEEFSVKMEVLREALPHYRSALPVGAPKAGEVTLTARQHQRELDRQLEAWLSGLNLHNLAFAAPFALAILESLAEQPNRSVAQAIWQRKAPVMGVAMYINDPPSSTLVPPRPDPTRYSPAEYQDLANEYLQRERVTAQQRGFVPEQDREREDRHLRWLILRLVGRRTLEEAAAYPTPTEEVGITTVVKALNANDPKSLVSALPDLLLGTKFHPKPPS